MTKITITPIAHRRTGSTPATTWRAALGPGFANGLTQTTTNLLAKSAAVNPRR